MGQPRTARSTSPRSPARYADTPSRNTDSRIVLAHEHIEQVQRFDSLIALLPGKRHRSLQRLLRLNS